MTDLRRAASKANQTKLVLSSPKIPLKSKKSDQATHQMSPEEDAPRSNGSPHECVDEEMHQTPPQRAAVHTASKHPQTRKTGHKQEDLVQECGEKAVLDEGTHTKHQTIKYETEGMQPTQLRETRTTDMEQRKRWTCTRPDPGDPQWQLVISKVTANCALLPSNVANDIVELILSSLPEKNKTIETKLVCTGTRNPMESRHYYEIVVEGSPGDLVQLATAFMSNLPRKLLQVKGKDFRFQYTAIMLRAHRTSESAMAESTRKLDPAASKAHRQDGSGTPMVSYQTSSEYNQPYTRPTACDTAHVHLTHRQRLGVYDHTPPRHKAPHTTRHSEAPATDSPWPAPTPAAIRPNWYPYPTRQSAHTSSSILETKSAQRRPTVLLPWGTAMHTSTRTRQYPSPP